MEDINYNEVFGLESEETQEIAEPAPSETETQPEENVSEETQEIADPAVDREESPEETKGEEDAKYAAARRKAEAERDAAVKQAQEAAERVKQDAEKYVAEAIKNLGLTNPYTKQPIVTKAEYDEYKTKFSQEKRDQVMKKSGMTEPEFDDFIQSLPQVREATEQAERAKAEQEQARKEREQAEINRQMENIRKLDPTIQTAADILKMDTADVFREKISRGYTFEDAFRIANAGKLMQAASAGAKQAALNAQSKGHMERTTTRGTGMEPVPADVLAEYREFLPNATDDEIRQHYNRYIKRN